MMKFKRDFIVLFYCGYFYFMIKYAWWRYTMNKVILIKYGELSTKKGNRNFFIKTLYRYVASESDKPILNSLMISSVIFLFIK